MCFPCLRRLPVPTLALFLVACAGMGVPAANQMAPGSATRLVTASQIERSGARTAWEALRATLPGLSLRETRVGTPVSIGRRGRSSLYLSSSPIVLVDFVRISDLGLLRDIAAGDVLTIELINGIDASTYFGTNAGSGAILIRTKVASDRKQQPSADTPTADSTGAPVAASPDTQTAAPGHAVQLSS